MSVTAHWGNTEKTILIYTFKGQWTWAENEVAMAEAFQLVSDANTSVDIIADFSQTSLFPAKILSNFKNILAERETEIPFGIAVIVSKGAFLKSMLDMFGRLYGRKKAGAKLKAVGSLEEAYQIIRNVAETNAPNS